MFITRIRLINWKNFHDCDVRLSGRCFVIGANASGKSNFLDALRFLRDIVKQGGGLQSAVDSRGGVSKIRCLAARTKTDVRVEVELSDSDTSASKWLYAVDFQNKGGGIVKSHASLIEETVYNYTTKTVVLHRTPDNEDEDAETLKYTHLEQVTANKDFREIKNAFAAIEYLNIIPEMVRESGSIVMTTGKEDYYGRNFLSRMATLNDSTRKSYLHKINKILSLAVPQLEELTFAKDDKGIPHIEARYRHWRARGSKQDERMFSDGTLRLIGFLFAMLDGSGTILLEEPESNLHAAIVEQIPEFVANIQLSKHRQVIITTHSYEILSNQGIDASELVILATSAEGTTAQNGMDINIVKTMMETGLTAADATAPMTSPEMIEQMNQENI